MKIGIDGSFWSNQRRGHDRYGFELAKALDIFFPNDQFFVYSPFDIELPVRSERWILRTGGQLLSVSPVSWLKTVGSYLCWQDKLDVFWGTYYFLPYLPKKTKTILTVHDFWYQISPESLNWLHVMAKRIFLKSDIQRADSVVTVSQGTAQRLFDWIGYKSEIISPAISDIFQPQDQEQINTALEYYSIHTPYLLNIATWEPRKNVKLLVKTFIRMKQEGLIPSHQLVLVGKKGWDYEDIETLIVESRLNSITVINYIPNDHLPALYAGSDSFVFPSIYEGFGIPVLEARACGSQAVTTDIPELRQAGGTDTIYIQPTEKGIREGILKALNNPISHQETIVLPSWEEEAKKLAAIISEE